jgi:hypothetical protein
VVLWCVFLSRSLCGLIKSNKEQCVI